MLAGIIEGGFYKDNKGLSERIWRVADSFEKDIGYIVNRGIAEKKSALELARDLEQYVKPPAKRDFDWGKVYPNLSGKKVDFNAQRLARTSINHAYHLDNVKVCTENPFVVAMHWDLSNAHYERQVIPFGPDECDEYAEHDEGLGEGNWKPEEIPVPHPQCLCAQWAVIPRDLEDIGAQIGRWASGEPDERLDEWYAQYGGRNPNGDPKEILREGLKYQGDGGIIKTSLKPDIQLFARRKNSDFPTLWLPPKEYGHVMHEVATNITKEQMNQSTFSKAIGDYVYTFANEGGFGDWRVIGKEPIVAIDRGEHKMTDQEEN